MHSCACTEGKHLRPLTERTTEPSQVEDFIREVIKEPAYLVGNSLGVRFACVGVPETSCAAAAARGCHSTTPATAQGYLSVCVASQTPELARGLILLNATPFWSQAPNPVRLSGAGRRGVACRAWVSLRLTGLPSRRALAQETEPAKARRMPWDGTLPAPWYLRLIVGLWCAGRRPLRRLPHERDARHSCGASSHSAPLFAASALLQVEHAPQPDDGQEPAQARVQRHFRAGQGRAAHRQHHRADDPADRESPPAASPPCSQPPRQPPRRSPRCDASARRARPLSRVQARDVFVSIFLSPKTPLSFNEMLQRIKCPVALVYGKEDPWRVGRMRAASPPPACI